MARAKSSNKILFCLSSCPTTAVAHKLARTLVKEKLAACVQCLPHASSYYWWQGKLVQDQECLLLIKTTISLRTKVEARLLKLHPYQLPEFVTLAVSAQARYLKWVKENTR